ncbi:Histone-lysine N-methyltransferase eggless [Halotydeus destructor]|nr:Histone-lysine N-methyltransferase eggless [Halotydeus destructor]
MADILDGQDHRCSPKCIEDEVALLRKCDIDDVKHFETGGLFSSRCSPFKVPMLVGFKRLVSSDKVHYVSPCSKVLAKTKQIRKYLKETQSKLTIEQFSFELKMSFELKSVDSEVVISNDISNGEEAFAIPCTNSVNQDKLETSFVYRASRVPGGNVDLNQDFRSCCDCEDGCSNPLKCQCLQLTRTDFLELDNVVLPSNPSAEMYGYDDRRRTFLHVTGIYECNDSCTCSRTCNNRLVQNGITCHLEVFMTENRGWGVRTLHDIPAASFVCNYQGEIMSSEEADKIGPVRGDEYFTALFYQSLATKKAGFEDGVSSIELSSVGSVSEESSDEGDKTLFSVLNGVDARDMIQAKEPNQNVSKKRKLSFDENDAVLKRPNFGSILDSKSLSVADCLKAEPHVLDAKVFGNVGKYLNHSCNPNCILLSTFVDTHDFRFPWYSFFTIDYIPAGTELTWDYLYEKGSEKFDCLCEHCQTKNST